MNKQEFIVSLKKELKKLPPEEIVAATEYFEEYFDEVAEGGEKTEEEIINEFGTPKKFAAQIRADYAARILEGDEEPNLAKPTNKLSAIWWVLIGIVSAPVSIPLAIVAFWIVVGLICMIIGIYLMIIGCGAFAVFSIAMGIMSVGASTASVFMLIGFGLLLLAASVAAAAGAIIGTKAMFKAMGRGLRSMHDRRKKVQGV